MWDRVNIMIRLIWLYMNSMRCIKEEDGKGGVKLEKYLMRIGEEKLKK